MKIKKVVAKLKKYDQDLIVESAIIFYNNIHYIIGPLFGKIKELIKILKCYHQDVDIDWISIHCGEVLYVINPRVSKNDMKFYEKTVDRLYK